MSDFDFRTFDVYHLALEAVRLSTSITVDLPPGHHHLADQLRRACSSVPLNIAEGAGEFSRAEKARFYRIARRSATESAATVDLMRLLDLPSGDDLAELDDLLLRVAQMLTKLVLALERQPVT